LPVQKEVFAGVDDFPDVPGHGDRTTRQRSCGTVQLIGARVGRDHPRGNHLRPRRLGVLEIEDRLRPSSTSPVFNETRTPPRLRVLAGADQWLQSRPASRDLRCSVSGGAQPGIACQIMIEAE